VTSLPPIDSLYYEAEIETMPDAERQEVRDIYASKGFSGDLLERVVQTITANRDSWLSTMMDEELHLQPVESRDVFRSAVVITIATLIGHLIPLVPFLLLGRGPARSWLPSHRRHGVCRRRSEASRAAL